DAVVLVVDDDDHARADVDRALTDVGAHVLTAGTFDEALALARRERPRVILVDPVVSHHVDDGDAPSSAADAGLAFLAAAAEDPDVDAALVVLSALVSLPRGLVTAAQLVKPALPHELVAIVERVAARTDAS
ncbi:MAG: hypothetical protein KC636_17890, partial [Myxococcales bacterium]|nr:hypothetical protein [Myxococcales bacterium]